MFLASKAASAGLVVVLATGILGPRKTPLAPGVNLTNEVPAIERNNDVKTMQQNLRNKGQYRGEVDDVFGLRTRASICGFQKAENLLANGQLKIGTGGELGISPEGREATCNETTKGKPSACIKWTKGSRRTSMTVPKAVKPVAAPENSPGNREKTIQAENDNHLQ
jgi:peptidoglycan hydrolase-like protein with peptidoglycan-binding domain